MYMYVNAKKHFFKKMDTNWNTINDVQEHLRTALTSMAFSFLIVIYVILYIFLHIGGAGLVRDDILFQFIFLLFTGV